MTLTAGNLVLDSTPDPFYDENQQPSLDLRFAEGKNLNDYKCYAACGPPAEYEW